MDGEAVVLYSTIRHTRRPPPTTSMSEQSQITVPDAFTALYVSERTRRPSAPREVIAARHELCEDLAQMLVETARLKLFELGVAECDVLQRVQQGLQADGSPVSSAEADWVTGRLAELLDWQMAVDPTVAISVAARPRAGSA
jgi:hypothetical protein